MKTKEYSEEMAETFAAVWMYCLMVHKVATLKSGPCTECIEQHARER